MEIHEESGIVYVEDIFKVFIPNSEITKKVLEYWGVGEPGILKIKTSKSSKRIDELRKIREYMRKIREYMGEYSRYINVVDVCRFGVYGKRSIGKNYVVPGYYIPKKWLEEFINRAKSIKGRYNNKKERLQENKGWKKWVVPDYPHIRTEEEILEGIKRGLYGKEVPPTYEIGAERKGLSNHEERHINRGLKIKVKQSNPIRENWITGRNMQRYGKCSTLGWVPS